MQCNFRKKEITQWLNDAYIVNKNKNKVVRLKKITKDVFIEKKNIKSHLNI